MTSTSRFSSFSEFYPFYLAQHQSRLCRRAHFIGTSSALAALVQFGASLDAAWLLVALLSGYGGAWIGHFFFEKNRPASFGYPLYSFMGDWVMYWQMLTAKLTW